MISQSFLLALSASVAVAHPPPWSQGSWSGESWSHGWDASHTSAAVASNTPAPSSVKGPNSAGFKNASTVLSRGGQAVCVDGYVSVNAQTAKNVKFNFAIPPNETVVTETFLQFITAGSPFLKSINQGYQTEGGSFDIKATYCTPKDNLAPTEVQLLTHGIGFDREYWDFAPGYSYVDVAAKHGYATFFYDRLGVGQSQKADPISVVQAPLQIEIANSIGMALRNGAYSNNKFSKVVGVGHSFGSIISTGVTELHPKTFDATILTGFSVNSTGTAPFTTANNLDIASQNSPQRFGELNNGYLVANNIISNQYAFFRFPQFDPAVLAAAEASKQTVTFGEFFTLGGSTGPSANYTAPVAVVNGADDLPFCFGNCSYPMNLAAAVKPALYPNVAASNFDSYLAPGTGHGVNLHYTAVAAYEWIQNFLASHNL
ncbi:hypothetical protein MRB53_037237 [Persea americana]|nr:hypothetical protein MRB53_037237 [Persea americana]